MGSAQVMGGALSTQTVKKPKKKKSRSPKKIARYEAKQERKTEKREAKQTRRAEKSPPKGIGTKQERADKRQEDKVKMYQHKHKGS